MRRLGVNIDHVATIRNARGGIHPDPVKLAIKAEQAGADGITVHLREDRRHIKDQDLELLKNNISIPINLEMAATEEMIKIAIAIKPNSVCIVPEKRQELTTEGGLDVIKNSKKLSEFIKLLKSENIKISLFVNANKEQIAEAKRIGADIVEIHTGEFCSGDILEKHKEFKKIALCAKYATEIGLECHAGHGLDYHHSKEIIKIREIKELNIGHFLIGEAIFDGIEAVVKKFKAILNEGK